MSIVHSPPETLVALTLATAEIGQYRCEQVCATGQNAIRLKQLGICSTRTLELVGKGDPMVLQIGASRVGLSRELARLVTVEPIPENSSSASAS